ncbi:LytR/AlgR family response regulator transcription factor [Sphingobacterium corticibacterium]|uniref:Response regulator transcription factor n=1 Tax=Sphingobacterium corticibacterium TaxID=2484746 RepID=A0A4V2DCH2_9SPHI|nr:LytTR family DNA-binding domain-containing protein [Sphingobacterium corticibacterium]RZF61478.1 response regulator transcription factor [Sphingobacterium corticibacterium]
MKTILEILKCVVLDDERAPLLKMQRLIKSRPELLLVKSSTNPDCIIDLIERADIQILFVDMEMEAMHGLEVIRRVKGKVHIICCTAYNNFASEIMELAVDHYLLKPMSEEKFNLAVDRVLVNCGRKKSLEPDTSNVPLDILQTVGFRTPGKNAWFYVTLGDIEYIEAGERTSTVYHTPDQAGQQSSASTTVAFTITEMEQLLPAKYFIRVHRGFILPVHRIREYSVAEGIKLRGSTRKEFIPVGDKYKAALEDRLRLLERFKKQYHEE